ncbi:MAG: helix-turn-helix domain-containing protein [Aquihabitans sp.]
MLQAQARALGDPTRHAIFRFLADADRPTTVAELVDHVQVNHTAVRQHLNKLVDANLVESSTMAPTGRGRPKLQYEVSPTADSRWGVTGPYERLAMLLAEVVRTGDEPIEVGRRAGRELRGDAGLAHDPLAEFAGQMARQGFEPTVALTGTDAVITLQSCPFATVVLDDPDTVCDMHRGLAEGLAQSVGGLTVDEFDVDDPVSAVCVIHCHLSPEP